MWICSNCGSRNDAEFCATCGKSKSAGASGVPPAVSYTAPRPAGGMSRTMEVVTAVLMMIGIIILLFAPIVSGSDFAGYHSYNIQQMHKGISDLKDEMLSYVDMLGADNSDVQQAVSSINAILFAVLVVILLLYAAALITLVNFFRKTPRLYTAVRWIAFSIAALLLILLIIAKSQMNTESSGLVGGLMSSYVKFGFGGVIFGLIFTGAAVLLHAKPELLSGVTLKEFGEKTGLQWRCSNPSCGHMNNNGSLFCSFCGTRKDSGTVVPPPPSMWKCSNPACGHTNVESSFFCSKCGTRKGGATFVPPPTSWRCANGHTNTGDNLFCSVCGVTKNADVFNPKLQWRCTCGRENDMSRTVCAYCGRPKNGGDSGLFDKNPEF